MRGAADSSARDAAPETPLQRITVRDGGRVYFLRCGDIGWIEAAGNYSRAHVGSKSHLVRTSLKELERKLPGDTFVRVHRGIIVNLEHVEEIQPYMHGDFHVHLRDGTVVRMSRRYRAAVLS
jgi:two-component system LytT family response regulator